MTPRHLGIGKSVHASGRNTALNRQCSCCRHVRTARQGEAWTATNHELQCFLPERPKTSSVSASRAVDRRWQPQRGIRFTGNQGMASSNFTWSPKQGIRFSDSRHVSTKPAPAPRPYNQPPSKPYSPPPRPANQSIQIEQPLRESRSDEAHKNMSFGFGNTASLVASLKLKVQEADARIQSLTMTSQKDEQELERLRWLMQDYQTRLETQQREWDDNLVKEREKIRVTFAQDLDGQAFEIKLLKDRCNKLASESSRHKADKQKAILQRDEANDRLKLRQYDEDAARQDVARASSEHSRAMISVLAKHENALRDLRRQVDEADSARRVAEDAKLRYQQQVYRKTQERQDYKTYSKLFHNARLEVVNLLHVLNRATVVQADKLSHCAIVRERWEKFAARNPRVEKRYPQMLQSVFSLLSKQEEMASTRSRNLETYTDKLSLEREIFNLEAHESRALTHYLRYTESDSANLSDTGFPALGSEVVTNEVIRLRAMLRPTNRHIPIETSGITRLQSGHSRLDAKILLSGLLAVLTRLSTTTTYNELEDLRRDSYEYQRAYLASLDVKNIIREANRKWRWYVRKHRAFDKTSSLERHVQESTREEFSRRSVAALVAKRAYESVAFKIATLERLLGQTTVTQAQLDAEINRAVAALMARKDTNVPPTLSMRSDARNVQAPHRTERDSGTWTVSSEPQKSSNEPQKTSNILQESTSEPQHSSSKPQKSSSEPRKPSSEAPKLARRVFRRTRGGTLRFRPQFPLRGFHTSHRDQTCATHETDRVVASNEWSVSMAMPGDHTSKRDNFSSNKMPDKMTDRQGIGNTEGEIEGKTTANSIVQSADEWPDLSYILCKEDETTDVTTDENAFHKFWKYSLYKDSSGKSPSRHYCTTYEQAEAQATHFQNEHFVGFDLEWDSRAVVGKSNIKRLVSLIQIASESRIGLFQISLFRGSTPQDLVPPALRTILESPDTIKAGVNVAGDATRMSKHLGIEMRGLFELSHLYKIVNYPKFPINKRIVRLDTLVQEEFSMPLQKDEVQVSNWTQKLDSDQIDYACSDAYAGFRLFHSLEAKRRKMKPTPPRPAFHELRQPLILPDGTAVESKPRSRKAAQDEGDEEDEFVDAPETQETFELAPEFQNGTEVDATSEVAANVVEGAVPNHDSSLSKMDEREFNESNKHSRASTPSRTTLSTAEVQAADEWIVGLRASLPEGHSYKSSDTKQTVFRTYHIWHVQGFDLKTTAAMQRDPPLSVMTVASYIMQAISEVDLPYDPVRTKEPVMALPSAARSRYHRIIAAINASTM